MALTPSARHPRQEVLIVGIIGSSTNTFSKSWLYNEFSIFDEYGNENNHLRDSFCHIASNQDRFTKCDPFEWMRGIHKNDTCQEKVFLYIHFVFITVYYYCYCLLFCACFDVIYII